MLHSVHLGGPVVKKIKKKLMGRLMSYREPEFIPSSSKLEAALRVRVHHVVSSWAASSTSLRLMSACSPDMGLWVVVVALSRSALVPLPLTQLSVHDLF